MAVRRGPQCVNLQTRNLTNTVTYRNDADELQITGLRVDTNPSEHLPNFPLVLGSVEHPSSRRYRFSTRPPGGYHHASGLLSGAPAPGT